MNKLLKTKLLKLEDDLKKERATLKNIFMPNRTREDIMRRNRKQIIEEYNTEQETLKKYKTDNCEMIDYIVELDFALSDLYFIIKFK